jgi:hypothetical protein
MGFRRFALADACHADQLALVDSKEDHSIFIKIQSAFPIRHWLSKVELIIRTEGDGSILECVQSQLAKGRGV